GHGKGPHFGADLGGHHVDLGPARDERSRLLGGDRTSADDEAGPALDDEVHRVLLGNHYCHTTTTPTSLLLDGGQLGDGGPRLARARTPLLVVGEDLQLDREVDL